MKNSSKLLLTALLLGLASSVAAAENIYAAIDVGQGNAPDACTGLPSTVTCSSTTNVYRFGLGVQTTKNVGIEASYIDAGKISASGTYLGWPATASQTASGFQFSAVGSYPLGNAIELLGKAGIAMITGKSTVIVSTLSSSSEQSNTNFTMGVGARYMLNDKFLIRGMYEDLGSIKTSSTGTGGKVTVLSFGVQIGL